MKGQIYPTKYGYQVRFGRKLTKHFKNLGDAERFLNGIRFKMDEGTFDIRDYQRGNPMGFQNLAEKWLDMKFQTVKPGTSCSLKNFINQAVAWWGSVNIKNIGSGEIEDFIFHDKNISNKTRSNLKSCLHDFFKWVSRRERIPMPEFPEVPFELGWRNIIDLDTQQKVLDEIYRISWHLNPKIYLGIHLLRTYVSIRPGELVNVKERQIDLKMGAIIIPHPKEKRPKIAFLMDDDIDLIKSIPRGLPDLFYFRHGPGRGGITPGEKFGSKYFLKWWKKACDNLGVEGVDLYGGTRHSTVTALGKICTPEEVKDASGHS